MRTDKLPPVEKFDPVAVAVLVLLVAGLVAGTVAIVALIAWLFW
jgi:hypothetical protein